MRHFKVRGWMTSRYGGAIKQVGIGVTHDRRPLRLSLHLTISTKRPPRSFR